MTMAGGTKEYTHNVDVVKRVPTWCQCILVLPSANGWGGHQGAQQALQGDRTVDSSCCLIPREK